MKSRIEGYRYSWKDLFAKKKELPEGFEYYMKLQLFVRDRSVATDSDLYIIFVCTIDGKGKDFIKAPADRKEPDKAYFKRLKRIYKMLVRPTVTVDFMVEAVQVSGQQPVFFLVDTALTID